MNQRIYADYAATTPMCEAAKEKMISLLDTFGNPSSTHKEGQKAWEVMEMARRQVAKAINAEPEEIFFTSGGSEANAAVLRQGWKFPASPIEHPSILKNQAVQTGIIQVDHHGTVQPFTAPCACIMLVNNEVGTIQPIKELGSGGEENDGVTRWLHVDAVQGVGHIPVDVKGLCVDTLSLSGHKFGAPKGVGALYISKRINRSFFKSLIPGGGQEGGIRSGTENVLGIAAMGAAIEWAAEHMEEHRYHVQPLRDKLIDGIAAIRGAELTGHPTNRASGIASFIFSGVEGQALVGALDEDGIAASAGSACAAGHLTPSHVLLAMGYTEGQAMGALRLSIGWNTTEAEVDTIIQTVRRLVRKLRGR